ncbi:MAG TPA: 2-oxo acid dehydrogenase subunit E2 [Myxococcales bacterium]|nr:2-oxo acid dehydrogenase subunit E2 [Myxococcales bacterium]
MRTGVELPALGESVVEGTVSRWLVAAGDRVEVDQPLVEVTTDKVDAEIPSPVAGIVVEILAAEGDVVPVGARLAEIDPEASGAQTGVSPASPSAPLAPSAPVAGAPGIRPESKTAPAPAPSAARATPVARRLADESQVSLDGITGSGSAGRITKQDVLRHTQTQTQTHPGPKADEGWAASGQPAAPPVGSGPVAPTSGQSSKSRPSGSRASRPAYTPVEGDRVIPMSPMRRIIAEHMVYSKHISPHVGTVTEVDMSGVVALRAARRVAFEAANGFGLTFLPFIVYAVVRALKEFPALNASVIEGAIVEKKNINVGLAVETEKGLVVPVVRNADRLSLSGLAAAIDEVAQRARTKKLSADDLQGGTFTVSNPGRKGNLYGFAIINQPQVGIVRMGEMVKKPVVRTLAGEDAIVIRPMMHIALSYDHRAVDGAPANGFLYRIREGLEQAEYDL